MKLITDFIKSKLKTKIVDKKKIGIAALIRFLYINI